MAEQSKFAGALGRLKNKPAPAKSGQSKDDEQQSPRLAPLQPTGKARPAGKRSDPAYSPTTFFVRKETKRRAAQLLLEDVNSKTDLSDLVEELLAKWVSEHSNV
jgi:hypothetical protein